MDGIVAIAGYVRIRTVHQLEHEIFKLHLYKPTPQKI